MDENASVDFMKSLKKEIRAWEKSFFDANGRKPDKKDVLGDRLIAKKYKQYNHLRNQMKEADLDNTKGKNDDEAKRSSQEEVSPLQAQGNLKEEPSPKTVSQLEQGKQFQENRGKQTPQIKEMKVQDHEAQPSLSPKKLVVNVPAPTIYKETENLPQIDQETSLQSNKTTYDFETLRKQKLMEYQKQETLRRKEMSSAAGRVYHSGNAMTGMDSIGIPQPLSKPLRPPSGFKATTPEKNEEEDPAKVIASLISPSKEESSILKEFMERKREVETITSAHADDHVALKPQSPRKSTIPKEKEKSNPPASGRLKSEVGSSMDLDIEQELVEDTVRTGFDKPNVLTNMQWVDLENQPTILSTDKIENQEKETLEYPEKKLSSIEKKPSITFISAESKDMYDLRIEANTLTESRSILTPTSVAGANPSETVQIQENSPEEDIPPIALTEVPSPTIESSPEGSGDLQDDIENVPMGPPATVEPQPYSPTSTPSPGSYKVETPHIPSNLFVNVQPEYILRCKLYRKRPKVDKVHPTYFLYNEADNSFLLAAKKRIMTKNPHYIISSNKDNMNRDSEDYVGKLRSNFQGTSFILYDARGYNKTGAKEKNLIELAGIIYLKNTFPREMLVGVPALILNDDPSQFSKNILDDIKQRNNATVQLFRNKSPKWNEATQTHCLNFHGRVTVPSVKNFQLIMDGKGEDIENYIAMQFGRIGEDTFTMDVRYPLKPIEAFAVALSTFDAYDST